MPLTNRCGSRTVYLVLLVLSVCPLFQQVQAKGAKGDLVWQKAVAIAQANKGWIPGSAILRIELLNKHGEVEQREETLLHLVSDETGEAPAGPYVDPGSLNIVGNSPFEPEFQNEISVYFTGETKNVEGRQCVRYDYVWRKETEVLTGTAWLEQDTGIPVKTESSGKQSVRPKLSSRQRVTVIFHHGSGGAWFPQRMVMEIEGGLFTLGRDFRITLEYRGYRRTQ